MNGYLVTNGYVGESDTHVFVIAETPEEAHAIASPAFKAEAKDRYPEGYWTQLNVTQIIAQKGASQVFS